MGVAYCPRAAGGLIGVDLSLRHTLRASREWTHYQKDAPMPELSPTLSLPYLQPAQAQKHVTHNEALRILDAVTQLGVITAAWPTPPSLPSDGDRYLVAGPATGLWTGQENTIAVWAENAWTFYAPRTGWHVDVDVSGQTLRFDGTNWVAPTLPDLQNLTSVGINTTADATNKLAVSAEATLLNNAGAGHQLKLNKAAPSDTASLLFQTSFSGRAEMGTAGSDGFSIKVSPDGSAFETALSVDEVSGATTAKKRFFMAGIAANQTGVVDQTQTTILFDTAMQNDGGMMNLSNGRLTPPAGGVSAIAGTYATGMTPDAICSIGVWKNGVLKTQKVYFASSSGSIGMDVTLHDVCSGSDYYEIRVYVTTAGTATLNNNTANTYFSGFHH